MPLWFLFYFKQVDIYSFMQEWESAITYLYKNKAEFSIRASSYLFVQKELKFKQP